MAVGEISIHTDGGSRGNPGPAACAFVVEDGSGVLKKGSKYLGRATNNVAEYYGVLIALDWLKHNTEIFKNKTIIFYLDSELIVRQLTGVYRVKDENLKKLHQEALIKIAGINTKALFKNVRREQNKNADLLVNESLDGNIQNVSG